MANSSNKKITRNLSIAIFISVVGLGVAACGMDEHTSNNNVVTSQTQPVAAPDQTQPVAAPGQALSVAPANPQTILGHGVPSNPGLSI